VTTGEQTQDLTQEFELELVLAFLFIGSGVSSS
jgi:hypothetical protein